MCSTYTGVSSKTLDKSLKREFATYLSTTQTPNQKFVASTWKTECLVLSVAAASAVFIVDEMPADHHKYKSKLHSCTGKIASHTTVSLYLTPLKLF